MKKANGFLRVIFFDYTTSVFNIAEENKSFSLNIPGHWTSDDGEEIINNLKNLLELRSENDNELYVKEVDKGGI